MSVKGRGRQGEKCGPGIRRSDRPLGFDLLVTFSLPMKDGPLPHNSEWTPTPDQRNPGGTSGAPRVHVGKRRCSTNPLNRLRSRFFGFGEGGIGNGFTSPVPTPIPLRYSLVDTDHQSPGRPTIPPLPPAQRTEATLSAFPTGPQKNSRTTAPTVESTDRHFTQVHRGTEPGRGEGMLSDDTSDPGKGPVEEVDE